MGKGRAPCCEKSKVKRGPWSPQEDLTLITFIQKHGHQNWRSLPKLAGLMRCGKSCRLRWINYLRPDVKRGNFSKEEEDAIIHYHQTFGNRWSKIASFLPGRTDNEIKNVWNTHLKKRLDPISSPSSSSTSSSVSSIHHPCKDAKQHSGVDENQESATSSHFHVNCMDTELDLNEVDELNEIQLLLDLDDFDDMTSDFLQTTHMLFPDLPLDFLQTHFSAEFQIKDGVSQDQVTKPQSFDHPQPADMEKANGEFDLWTQLVHESSSLTPTPIPNNGEDNEWFNFIDNETYFDDFKLVGEACL